MPTADPCPRCGTPLPTDSELCPRCLMAAAASSGAEPGADFEAPAPDDLAPHFDDLAIEELVGRGGMGVVYRARQKRLDRLVALKLLPRELARDPAFTERFAREARALAQLDHPNVVRVHDFGQSDDFSWLVLEWIDGTDLRRVLETSKLEPEQALAIVPQICDALQAAHERGIVHRDIKPENILLDRRGRVKIADFGLAKLVARAPIDVTLTRSQQVMGTWHYMAPEQLQGSAAIDHRADIYSLGVVFYEMLTGTVPVGNFAPPSRGLPVGVALDEIVLKALASEPEQRYQTAVAVKTDVEHLKGPVAEGDPPADAGERERGERTRRATAEFFRDFGLAAVAVPCALPFLQLGWPGLALAGLVFGLFALGACKLRKRGLPDVRAEQARWSFGTRCDRELGALTLLGLGFVAQLLGIAIRLERGTDAYHPARADASTIANHYDDFEYRIVRQLALPDRDGDVPAAFFSTESMGYSASLRRVEAWPPVLLAALLFLAGAWTYFSPRRGLAPWPRAYFPASAFWTGSVVAFAILFSWPRTVFGDRSTTSELRAEGVLAGDVAAARSAIEARLAAAGYEVHSHWSAAILERGTDAPLGRLFSLTAARPLFERWSTSPLGFERATPHLAIHGFGALRDGGTRVVVEAGLVQDVHERREDWALLAEALVSP